MFDKILIPVNDSSGSQRAAHIGLEFAKRLGARVVLTNALIDFSTEDEGNRSLAPSSDLAQTLGVQFEKRFSEGRKTSVADGILETCQETVCDLIIMGTHGREGIEQLLLGSVAESVSRKANVPVMLICDPQDSKLGTQNPPRFERILVAIDGSLQSQQALTTANNLGAKLGASLEVLHVIPDIPLMAGYTGFEFAPMIDYDPYEKDLEAQSKAIIAGALKQLETLAITVGEVRSSSVPAKGSRLGDVIVQTASEHNADLIVIGTHGRSGLDRLLLGSVAQWVAHRSQTPVLLVRTPETSVKAAVGSSAELGQTSSDNIISQNPLPA